MTQMDVFSRMQRAIVSEDRTYAPLPPVGGSCTGRDTSWWFPSFGMNKVQLDKQKEAIKICVECPIRGKCLEYAMRWEAFGIWGGFTERQRDVIRKRFRVTQRRNSLAHSKAREDYSFSLTTEDQSWLSKNGF